MIRIFLADELPVVLAGLRSFFSGTEFRVVGEAANGLDLIRGVVHTCPHLVLVDTSQESFQGFSEDFHADRSSGTLLSCRWKYKILAISPYLKSASKRDLLEAVRKAAPRRERPRSLRSVDGKEFSLTTREVEILRLIVQGHCNKEIARLLGISLETVKEHVQNILRKTSLSDRTQAALWAVRQEIASL